MALFRIWLDRFGGWVFLLLLGVIAIIAGLLWVGSMSAKADGYEGYKDTIRGYSDPYVPTYKRPRAKPISYQRDTIRDHLTPDEKRYLRRLHSKALRRMERDRNRFARSLRRNGSTEFRSPVIRNSRNTDETSLKRRNQAYYDRSISQKQAQYAQRSRYDEDRGSRECRASLSVTSEERGWRGRALRDAQDKWSAKAIATHGYRFGNLDKARSAFPDCNPIRRNKFGVKIWVCDFSARPCRGI